MIFTRISASDVPAVELHPSVTVLAGLDDVARRTWAADLDAAVAGKQSSLRVDVVGGALSEIDGAPPLAIFGDDLPGAVRPDPASGRQSGLEAEVGDATGRVQQARSALAKAERAATEAADARTSAGRGLDRGASASVEAAEAALTAARAEESAASHALEAAQKEQAERDSSDTDRARQADRATQLRAEQANLESHRGALVAQLVATGDPGDTKSVEQALAGLRRLRQVQPKPSHVAAALADRWLSIRERLAALPQPPQPPEWLVTPALAALQEARAALAALEADGPASQTDPAKLAALDVAHREVLEAEQRVMKKGSRANRRRLDLAHDAEQAALAALGVSTYGEFLQRIAPMIDSPTGGRERIEAAKAAVTDAEAVWEELHGGQASPEWTEVKSEQASIRAKAHVLLGFEVDDAVVERSLRERLETVVDTAWAEQALDAALSAAGVVVADGAAAEAVADAWVAEVPNHRQRRSDLEAELSQLDGRLAFVEEQLAEHRADNFFAGEAAQPAPDAVETLRRAVDSAAAVAQKAEATMAEATAARVAADAQESRVAELETTEVAGRAEVDRLRAVLAKAETESRRVEERVGAEASGRALTRADLRAVVGMEAEAYLLARVAALRGLPGGPLPMVVDAALVDGLSDGASRRVLRLLGRLAGSMQLVILGDDEKITTWAAGLGDQAAIRSVVR